MADIYSNDNDGTGVMGSSVITLGFKRQYRHTVTQVNNGQANNVAPLDTNNQQTGWKITPIQNCWAAALKPTDLVGIDNLSKKYKCLEYGIKATKFNIKETQAAANGREESTTTPNVYIEMYIDKERDLPGYNADFLTDYATNNGYTTSDKCNLNDGDMELKGWHWKNTSGQTFNIDRQLNLFGNGSGFTTLNQNQPAFVWSERNGDSHWRHSALPWQNQLNPQAMRQRGDILRQEGDLDFPFNQAAELSSGEYWANNACWGGLQTVSENNGAEQETSDSGHAQHQETTERSGQRTTYGRNSNTRMEDLEKSCSGRTMATNTGGTRTSKQTSWWKNGKHNDLPVECGSETRRDTFDFASGGRPSPRRSRVSTMPRVCRSAFRRPAMVERGGSAVG
jgi:hypothetical protein